MRVLLTVIALASVGLCADLHLPAKKAKVKGTIMSRKGDLVKVQDEKTGSLAVVKITDDTKIMRDKSKVGFSRHEDMDVTAMVPGLTISAEGVGNADNQLEASKITFSPDVFAIEVAQQQEISANKSAAATHRLQPTRASLPQPARSPRQIRRRLRPTSRYGGDSGRLRCDDECRLPFRW